jgi:hypothetical protein
MLDRLRRHDAPALAIVYRRQGRLFVQANDRTVWATAGYWVSAGPVACLAVDNPPVVLGAAVVDALARSRIEVPVPERTADLEAPLRQAMGVRSRRALMEGTRACEVRRDDGELHVLPYDNGGTTAEGRGYRPQSDAQVLRLPADAPPEEVGRAVITALERATSRP